MMFRINKLLQNWQNKDRFLDNRLLDQLEEDDGNSTRRECNAALGTNDLIDTLKTCIKCLGVEDEKSYAYKVKTSAEGYLKELIPPA